jgi:hypothetical protein
MSTLEFVSTSAGGIADSDAALVTAPALVAALGTHPTLTVPMVSGRTPDTELIWAHLDETARFFGVDIPPVTALRDTVADFLDEATVRHGRVTLAARVMVADIDGRARFVVSASVINAVRGEPVVLTVTTASDPGPVPHWRRMAARTTSQAESDVIERALRTAGCVDEVIFDGGLVHRPRLGALIFGTAAGAVGTGADRLDLLRSAGLLDGVRYSDEPVPVTGTTHAWWVSPRFETHPVCAIGARHFEVAPS